MTSFRGKPLFSQRPASMSRRERPGRVGASEALPSGRKTQQAPSSGAISGLACVETAGCHSENQSQVSANMLRVSHGRRTVSLDGADDPSNPQPDRNQPRPSKNRDLEALLEMLSRAQCSRVDDQRGLLTKEHLQLPSFLLLPPPAEQQQQQQHPPVDEVVVMVVEEEEVVVVMEDPDTTTTTSANDAAAQPSGKEESPSQAQETSTATPESQSLKETLL
ncbi:hypothetical protein CRUP_009824 [Coryphaenoides rupestris]|nr:hypothetical protein CRUP_009824 [Coryphaenoides rupestris]